MESSIYRYNKEGIFIVETSLTGKSLVAINESQSFYAINDLA